jgi:peptidyl-prolyl cis-trans isomerase C
MKTVFKRRLTAIIPLFIAALSMLAPPPAAAEPTALAIVAGDPITRAEFDTELAGLPENYRAMAADPAVQKEFLDTLVTREVLFRMAEKKGLLAEPAIRKQIDDYTRKLAVATLLEREVEQQVARITAAEAKEYYTAHPDEFRQGAQVHARHILVGEQKEAARLLAQLKSGTADFADLARKHSTCPSAERGGDLGFFTRDRMDKPFADAAFALQPGELSEVIKTRFGYHIIKVEETRPAHQQDFDEVKEMLIERLRMERKNQLFTELVAQLKKEFGVEIHPERLD